MGYLPRKTGTMHINLDDRRSGRKTFILQKQLIERCAHFIVMHLVLAFYFYELVLKCHWIA